MSNDFSWPHAIGSLLAGSSLDEGGAGEVTVKPQPGAIATMALNFRPATNITIDGLKITGAEIGDSRTKNITVRNSDFDRAQTVYEDALAIYRARLGPNHSRVAHSLSNLGENLADQGDLDKARVLLQRGHVPPRVLRQVGHRANRVEGVRPALELLVERPRPPEGGG